MSKFSTKSGTDRKTKTLSNDQRAGQNGKARIGETPPPAPAQLPDGESIGDGRSLYVVVRDLIADKNRVANWGRTIVFPRNRFSRWAERINEQVPDQFRARQWFDYRVILMVLAAKILLFFFAGQSYQILEDKPINSFYGWLEIWNRWDSLRHLRLAEFGYTNVGQWRMDIVGFPLYPWLVRGAAFVFRDYLLSGFVVSGIASIAAALLLYRLVVTEQSDTLALGSVWFLLIFPTSYFLHINYTESLFLTLIFGCFLAMLKERWVLVGVLGALACLTRLNGLLIFPALVLELLLKYRKNRRLELEWLAILLVPLGFVVYLLLNRHVTGDLFAFISAGREFFYKSFATPWDGFWSTYKGIWRESATQAEMIGVQEFVFIVLGVISAIASCFLLRPAYAAWIVGNWLLVTSTGFVLGAPRYTLTLFPIYILFAKLAVGRIWMNFTITTWSLLYLAIFTSLFVRGHYAF